MASKKACKSSLSCMIVLPQKPTAFLIISKCQPLCPLPSLALLPAPGAGQSAAALSIQKGKGAWAEVLHSKHCSQGRAEELRGGRAWQQPVTRDPALPPVSGAEGQRLMGLMGHFRVFLAWFHIHFDVSLWLLCMNLSSAEVRQGLRYMLTLLLLMTECSFSKHL